MPHLIDTPSRTATLVRAINMLLAEGGPKAFTMRGLAAESRVSTSSILHHFGSRERLVVVAASYTARWRREDLLERLPWEGPLAFLPRDDDGIVDARSWLAWQELWRCEDRIGRVLHEARLEERAMFARSTDFTLCRDRLDEACAVLDGLLSAVCAPRAPMRLARAREVLATHLRRADVTLTPPAVSSF